MLKEVFLCILVKIRGGKTSELFVDFHFAISRRLILIAAGGISESDVLGSRNLHTPSMQLV